MKAFAVFLDAIIPGGKRQWEPWQYFHLLEGKEDEDNRKPKYKCDSYNKYMAKVIHGNPDSITQLFKDRDIYALALEAIGNCDEGDDGPYACSRRWLAGRAASSSGKDDPFADPSWREQFQEALVGRGGDFPDQSAGIPRYWSDIDWLDKAWTECEWDQCSTHLKNLMALTICTALFGPSPKHLEGLGVDRFGTKTETGVRTDVSFGIGDPTGKRGVRLDYIEFTNRRGGFRVLDMNCEVSPREEVIVGRLPKGGDVLLTVEDKSDTISRNHCRISCDRGIWKLELLSEKSGALIYGKEFKPTELKKRGERAELKHGDLICLRHDVCGFRVEYLG